MKGFANKNDTYDIDKFKGIMWNARSFSQEKRFPLCGQKRNLLKAPA